MFEALTAGPNLPFAVALGVMLAFAGLEILGLFFGVAFSGLVDSALPDFDADIDLDADIDIDLDANLDADVDADADVDGPAADAAAPGILMTILGWLCIGKVPALIILMFFLTAFGLSGLFLQGTLKSVLGIYLPGGIAAIPALFVAFPTTRMFGLGFAKIMPKEETEAVSRRAFVGRVATITRGYAKRGLPAEAKLRDDFGQTHYVLVEPDFDGDIFDAGSDVIIVRQVGSFYRVIENTSAGLS